MLRQDVYLNCLFWEQNIIFGNVKKKQSVNHMTNKIFCERSYRKLKVTNEIFELDGINNIFYVLFN